MAARRVKRHCKACGTKDRDKLVNDKSAFDGKRNLCKECDAAKKKLYRMTKAGKAAIRYSKSLPKRATYLKEYNDRRNERPEIKEQKRLCAQAKRDRLKAMRQA